MSEEIIRREFPAELTPSGDGRTIDLRVIPFNTVARVSDNGGRTFYDEEWLPGCFDKQLGAANRVDVLANWEHDSTIGGVIARGTELRDTGEALDGTFRMLSTQDADKALELINAGVASGVSLEAIPLKSERGEDGVMRRVKARLVNVALCRMPAFSGAKVLAVREGEPDPDEPAPDPEPVPDEPDSQRMSPQIVRDEMAAEELAKNPPEFSDAELALQRIGYEALPTIKRAITRRPWDGSAARFDDEQWRRSCIIDRGDKFDTAKTRYAMPILEPNGDLNVNGMHAAAQRFSQVQASPEAKATAARKLVRFYRQASEEAPDNVKMMAGR